jgi:hypothetical protein
MRSAKSARAATISAAPTPRRNFQTAFYRSALADNNSFEQWEVEGQKRIEDRANALCKSWLESYEAPALDPAIDEALLAFIKPEEGLDARRLHLKGSRSQGEWRTVSGGRLDPAGRLAPALQAAWPDIMGKDRYATRQDPCGAIAARNFSARCAQFSDGDGPEMAGGRARSVVLARQCRRFDLAGRFRDWRRSHPDRADPLDAWSDGRHPAGRGSRRRHGVVSLRAAVAAVPAMGDAGRRAAAVAARHPHPSGLRPLARLSRRDRPDRRGSILRPRRPGRIRARLCMDKPALQACPGRRGHDRPFRPRGLPDLSCW